MIINNHWLVVTGTWLLIFHLLGIITQLANIFQRLKPPTSVLLVSKRKVKHENDALSVFGWWFRLGSFSTLGPRIIITNDNCVYGFKSPTRYGRKLLALFFFYYHPVIYYSYELL